MGEPRHDLLDGGIDAGMDAEREAVAVGGNLLEQRVKLPGAPAHDVEDRSEYLFANGAHPGTMLHAVDERR